MLSLLQSRQSTSFSGYNSASAVVWSSIQSTYGVSYPTDVQPPVATPTYIYGYANTSYSSTTCYSGNTYTVVSGDSCQAIALANDVATGTLINLNQILPECTNLDIGQVLCLPQTCKTYTVASGDTCYSIAFAAGPSINSACTNLLSDTEV